MKKALCITILFFAFFAVSQTARADEAVYGLSGIWFDNTNNTATVGSLTAMTYGVALYYNTIHRMLTYQNNALVNDQTWYDPAGGDLEIYYQFANNFSNVWDHYTVHGLEIYYSIPCGNYNAFGFIDFNGSLGGGFTIGGLPWSCVIPAIIGLGVSAVEAAQAQQQVKCMETCKPCQTTRRAAKNTCNAVGLGCAVGAANALNVAIGNCNNNAFCNPSSPQFNKDQCDNCKNTAIRSVFLVGVVGCGGAYLICRNGLPDCTGLTSCPGGPYVDGNTNCPNP
jgi:hypothetical protein